MLWSLMWHRVLPSVRAPTFQMNLLLPSSRWTTSHT